MNSDNLNNKPVNTQPIEESVSLGSPMFIKGSN